MTKAEAHHALLGYLEHCHRHDRRVVLVITGKGTFRRGEEQAGGVLRQSVPRWLSETPLREKVLAWQPAQPRDGGEGALYVLLKRRRAL